MGNATSCAQLIISNGAVKVLLSNGTLQVYTRPVKAGQLMLENPGHFVCDSSGLKVGHRIQGLTADEELERRQFYFLLPMDLLYSVLTQEEMSSLTCKATKALKHHNFVKIFPVFSEFCMFPSEGNKNSVLLDCETNDQTDSVERYSKQRTWKPALETISETPSRPV